MISGKTSRAKGSLQRLPQNVKAKEDIYLDIMKEMKK